MTSMDDIINITVFTTEGLSTLGPSPTTDEDYDYEDMMCDREPVRLFRSQFEPPLFWIITLVGGAGNLAVVWIYLNFRRRLKTMSDVYLLNLAVADLLFLFTLPLWATEASRGWSFGPTLCRLNSALYKVNLFSSMLLLTCISVDRYIVIVQTTKAQNSKMKRRRHSRLVCAGVWLFALVLALPELIFATVTNVDSQQHCRMVFPSHLGNATNMTMTNCDEVKRFDVVGQVLKSVAYLHACLNPFLYAFVGERFRRDILRLIRCGRQAQVTKGQLSKSSRTQQSSARGSVMSDSDTSQALSL
ncbi:hypothetical protein INR49_003616 [Caranx melampygus]|nr:hypothetical protein INR49_003616 [Caranx melampygus]